MEEDREEKQQISGATPILAGAGNIIKSASINLFVTDKLLLLSHRSEAGNKVGSLITKKKNYRVILNLLNPAPEHHPFVTDKILLLTHRSEVGN